jgi:DNA-binding MarR family transcriptional regulator
MPRVPDPDPVEELFSAWRAERPDLDIDAMISVGRVMAVGRAVADRIEANARRYGLTLAAGDVLFTLRRAGAPYRLLPSRLSAMLFVPSGTLTGRLDKLEGMGLIERVANPDDRRSVEVQLTPRGLEATDAAVTAHVAMEAEILSVLTPGERKQLDALTRKLLAAASE